mmetsp:Transcript_89046/g.148531  ORF Transcript_89046/g.148531 Transcript_89046/m.148531 type:complete len:237 (+) Transcript_89046:664-1374(+)
MRVVRRRRLGASLASLDRYSSRRSALVRPSSSLICRSRRSHMYCSSWISAHFRPASSSSVLGFSRFFAIRDATTSLKSASLYSSRYGPSASKKPYTRAYRYRGSCVADWTMQETPAVPTARPGSLPFPIMATMYPSDSRVRSCVKKMLCVTEVNTWDSTCARGVRRPTCIVMCRAELVPSAVGQGSGRTHSRPFGILPSRTHGSWFEGMGRTPCRSVALASAMICRASASRRLPWK